MGNAARLGLKPLKFIESLRSAMNVEMGNAARLGLKLS